MEIGWMGWKRDEEEKKWKRREGLPLEQGIEVKEVTHCGLCTVH
jgi:hypothetical protein